MPARSSSRRLAASPGECPTSVFWSPSAGALGDSYRLLLHRLEHRGPEGVPHRAPRARPLRDCIVEAQAAGTLRDDVDTYWLFQAVDHMILAAAKLEFPDRDSDWAAIDALVRSLLAPGAAVDGRRARL